MQINSNQNKNNLPTTKSVFTEIKNFSKVLLLANLNTHFYDCKYFDYVGILSIK